MVPDSKQKQQVLNQLLRCSLPVGSFETAGPKRDGTVFVRCKSTEQHSAIGVSFQLVEAFNRLGVEFTQTDDTRFRVPLDRLGPG